MSGTAFEILAVAMRYWFSALFVYIVLRIVRSTWTTISSERALQKRAAGEYSYGFLEVLESENNRRLEGQRFALRKEMKIGRGSECDVRLKDRTIRKRHAVVYQKGNSINIRPYNRRSEIDLNGRAMEDDVCLMNGDEIQLGGVLLIVHIEGFSPPRLDERHYIDREEYDDDPEYLEEEVEEDEDDIQYVEEEEEYAEDVQDGFIHANNSIWNVIDDEDDREEDDDYWQE